MSIQSLKQDITNAVSKVIIGKEEVTELFLISMLCRGHVLLEDVPGTGKTVLAKTISKLLGGQFRRLQFTPDVLPSDVTGVEFFNPKEKQFEVRIGPVMTNVLLVDEINRATPRTQSSLLEVMEERQVTIGNETVQLPAPFFVLATQNPLESQGTFPLPDAQLDRFFMSIHMGYPNFEEELQIMRIYRGNEPLKEVTSYFESLEEFVKLQDKVAEVLISEDMEKYLLTIIHRTRGHEYIEAGVSPRGTLAFMRAVQARALLENRSYVTPDDVKRVAPYVLSHRLQLNLEGSLRMTKREVMEDILQTTEAPVEVGASS
ncbi:AAA family ATPase [Bacillus suaedaesalsae]|uniref:AAA family ATPase n=1 Tax=Bacillus suaedaesalsae TaxID=2810349 RepID=UPI001EF4BA0F|nr:MoxR family ATPase [Bacillus suaedaesalsae]